MTNAVPSGWHSVTPRIVVRDAPGLVTFIRRVFDASGNVSDDAPAQIRIGDSLVLISEADVRDTFPAFLYVYVADVDRTYGRALEAGASSIEAVWETPYGDRRAMVKDAWGNLWQIACKTLPEAADA